MLFIEVYRSSCLNIWTFHPLYNCLQLKTTFNLIGAIEFCLTYLYHSKVQLSILFRTLAFHSFTLLVFGFIMQKQKDNKFLKLISKSMIRLFIHLISKDMFLQKWRILFRKMELYFLVLFSADIVLAKLATHIHIHTHMVLTIFSKSSYNYFKDKTVIMGRIRRVFFSKTY